MIDKKELDERIAEIQYSRDQSPDECIYLASLFTIRDHLFPEDEETKPYSLASAPVITPVSVPEPLDNYGDSDFLIAIRGKVPADAWHVVDDLMDTLKAVNPRVYDSVMRKMRAL